jgi:hypothetical protein
MAKPTHQDATLMIQLAQWASTSGVPQTLRWLWSDQFIPDYAEFLKKYPPASEGGRSAAIVCTFFETVGTLHKQGLINEDLLFDWLWVAGPWDKLKGYALGQRQEAGVPELWENFEAMAVAQASRR